MRFATDIGRLAGLAVTVACAAHAAPLDLSYARDALALGTNGAPDVVWEERLAPALARAAAENRLVLLYFTMPRCNACRNLELTTFPSPAVRQRLRDLVCVRIDTTRDPELAAGAGVSATPTLLVCSADGRPRGRFAGYRTPAEFLALLAEATGGQGSADLAAEDAGRRTLKLVQSGRVPAGEWPQALLALGHEPSRPALLAAMLGLSPFPRGELAAQLRSLQLAVRLGALEVLEQAAGEDFGFDPWAGPPESGEPAPPALARWEAWAADTNSAAAVRYAALTREQAQARLLDLLADDRDRVQRARRQLMAGGQAVAELAADLLRQRAGLAPGLADRVREVRYATLLPPRPGADPATQAQRLVFGNLDVQLQALRDLRAHRAAAVPVIEEFLAHANPLVRETAVETLAAVARRDAIPRLRELLARERNREVVIAVARALGGLRGKAAAEALAGLLDGDDEDVAIVALRGLAGQESAAPPQAICKRLTDARWRVRVAALQAAGQLRLSEAAELVDKLIDDPDSFVRFTAIVTYPNLASHEKAARRLEKAFLQNDEVKAPAIAAFCEMDRALPASFVPALTNKPADVLLPVLDALARCRQRAVPVAAALVRHPDGDVACAALAILAGQAGRGSGEPLEEALRRGDRGRTLAVLEVLDIDDDSESRSWSSSDDGALDELLTEIVDSRAAAGASAGGLSALNDLLGAFLSTPAPAAPAPPPPAAVGLNDLFDAFVATQGVDGVAAADPAADRPASVPASTARLIAAVRASEERFADDAAVRQAALVARLRLRDTNAVSQLAREFDGLPDLLRRDSLRALGAVATPAVLDLAARGLRDNSEAVRAAAVSVVVRQLARPGHVDVLLGELCRKGTPLGLAEAADSLIDSGDLAKAAVRVSLSRWTTRLLDDPPTPGHRVLGVVLLEKAGRRQDVARLTPLLGSDDRFLRRAAFRTVARLEPANRSAFMARAAADLSEDVRAVVPAILGSARRGYWSHRFSEREAASSWEYSSSPARSLKEEERQVLRTLVSDPVPEIRAESLLALLAAGDPFDAEALMSAIGQSRDSAAMASLAAAALEASETRLNSRHAALAPLVETGRMSEEKRQVILKRLTGPAAAVAPAALALRASASPVPPAAGPEPPSPLPSAPATNVLRVVFFKEAGCEGCRMAHEFMEALKDAFPEMRVEAHEVQSDAGRRLNAALAERFGMPAARRGRAPTVFAGAGYLVGDEITFETLSDLLVRSLTTPLLDPAAAAP